MTERDLLLACDRCPLCSQDSRENAFTANAPYVDFKCGARFYVVKENDGQLRLRFQPGSHCGRGARSISADGNCFTIRTMKERLVGIRTKAPLFILTGSEIKPVLSISHIEPEGVIVFHDNEPVPDPWDPEEMEWADSGEKRLRGALDRWRRTKQ